MIRVDRAAVLIVTVFLAYLNCIPLLVCVEVVLIFEGRVAQVSDLLRVQFCQRRHHARDAHHFVWALTSTPLRTKDDVAWWHLDLVDLDFFNEIVLFFHNVEQSLVSWDKFD